ncbi:hypothetical protein GW17_00040872 [Ensete ventricosum]|nr:hypothetical protein GW17_00040872 [Ensete ventricosum]
MVWVIKQWGEVKTCVHHTGGAWGARGVLVAVGVAVPGVLPTIDVTPQPSPPSSSHRLFLFRSSLAVVNVVTSRDFARRILSVPSRPFYECEIEPLVNFDVVLSRQLFTPFGRDVLIGTMGTRKRMQQPPKEPLSRIEWDRR